MPLISNSPPTLGEAVSTGDPKYINLLTEIKNALNGNLDATNFTGAIAAVVAAPPVPIGSLVSYAGSGDPAGGKWLLADGRLIDRAAFPDFFAAVGHAYNGGVDPGSNMVRIPDKRGRTLVGADNMGTAQGAAGRLPNSNRARGENGGAERHAHTVNAHSHTVDNHAHAQSDSFSVSATNPASAQTHLSPGTEAAIGTTIPLMNHWHDGGIDGNTGGATPGTSNASPGTDQISQMQPYEVDNVIVRVA